VGLTVGGFTTDNEKTTACCGRQSRQHQLQQQQQLNDVTARRHCLRRGDIAMVMVIFAGQSAAVVSQTTVSSG